MKVVRMSIAVPIEVAGEEIVDIQKLCKEQQFIDTLMTETELVADFTRDHSLIGVRWKETRNNLLHLELQAHKVPEHAHGNKLR